MSLYFWPLVWWVVNCVLIFSLSEYCGELLSEVESFIAGFCKIKKHCSIQHSKYWNEDNPNDCYVSLISVVLVMCLSFLADAASRETTGRAPRWCVSSGRSVPLHQLDSLSRGGPRRGQSLGLQHAGPEAKCLHDPGSTYRSGHWSSVIVVLKVGKNYWITVVIYAHKKFDCISLFCFKIIQIN